MTQIYECRDIVPILTQSPTIDLFFAYPAKKISNPFKVHPVGEGPISAQNTLIGILR
jgi:hypothetical protein